MKTFYFKEKDNIYKIFQVIDKLPKKQKEVIFDINVNNDFFKNKWWLKLVLEKASEKKLNIVFVIESNRQEVLMKLFQVNCIWRKVPIMKKIMKVFWDFLENFKSDHSFYKKHYNIFKIIFLFLEIGFIISMVFFIYNLVVPKTDIYIQPYVKIKHLVQKFYIYPQNKKENYNIKKRASFPYVSKTFTKTYSIKIPVNNISYIAKPSEWQVKIINNTIKWFSLKSYTELVTSNWLLFKLKNWVYVPWKDVDWNPWIAKVSVKAEEKDEKWELIWVRWDLIEWKKLYIKKMYVSRWKKLIYAESLWNFHWWKTDAKWTVEVGDIKIIKENLLKTFKENLKKSIIQYEQAQNAQDIPLLYDGLYWYNNISYNINAKVWEKVAFVKGDIQWNIFYKSIKKEYLKNAFKDYLDKRVVSENEFLWWNENSIQILDLRNISNWLYIITVSIDALLWYDFNSDYNNIKNKIIQQVKWKPLQEAKNLILSNPEVAWADIKTTNTLDKVSDLKSRIFIHISK